MDKLEVTNWTISQVIAVILFDCLFYFSMLCLFRCYCLQWLCLSEHTCFLMYSFGLLAGLTLMLLVVYVLFQVQQINI